MINAKLLKETLKLVNDFYAAEHICETDAVIIEIATEWYNHTEIVDAETLAAVTISGRYTPGLKIEDILRIKETFYPKLPFEFTNFCIGEIEEALLDAEWR